MQADSTSMEKRRCTGWRTTWRRLPKDHSKQNPTNLSNTSQPRLFFSPSFPRQLLPEPFEVGRGSAPPMAGNGPAVRGSSVQGFPCRYYDWRVLDEHFERGFRQRAKQFTQSRGLPSGTDGIKKRRTGGLRIAFYSTKTRFDDRPSSQHASNGQTRKRAWQGKSTPTIQNGISTRGQISRESLR